VPLPTSISADAKLAPAHFVSTNSRLIESTGFNLKATSELTPMLLATLHRDFGIACNPEGNLVREPVVAGHAKGPIGKILLIGASNMRRVSSLLTGMGFTVEMLSLAGGIPSDAAIEQLKKDLLEKSVGGGHSYCVRFFWQFHLQIRPGRRESGVAHYAGGEVPSARGPRHCAGGNVQGDCCQDH